MSGDRNFAIITHFKRSNTGASRTGPRARLPSPRTPEGLHSSEGLPGAPPVYRAARTVPWLRARLG
eukprot:761004-Hanusia_phi.AAC.1